MVAKTKGRGGGQWTKGGGMAWGNRTKHDNLTNKTIGMLQMKIGPTESAPNHFKYKSCLSIDLFPSIYITLSLFKLFKKNIGENVFKTFIKYSISM